jgi:hypothetical protein
MVSRWSLDCYLDCYLDCPQIALQLLTVEDLVKI